MIWLSIVVIVLVISFGGVLLFGAPYLPTLSKQVDIALTLSGLEPGDTLIELGCGDGRVVLAAAKRGIKVIGYELNPFLALCSCLRTWRHRKDVKIIWGNFWTAEWPEAQAVFTFLLARYMSRLDKKMLKLKNKPTRLVSFAFEVPEKKAVASKMGIYVYDYN
jgi:16S rRNA A1518/A1519 N6-dimethyltransferase RsmA/KsgA/DIM1 with predicted DNA glycosylase/AP lyase activity